MKLAQSTVNWRVYYFAELNMYGQMNATLDKLPGKKLEIFEEKRGKKLITFCYIFHPITNPQYILSPDWHSEET